MKKEGKIKYADPDKGYGYILAKDASGPSDTTYFRMDEADEDDLVAGESVVFEENATPKEKQATQVQTHPQLAEPSQLD